MGKESSKESLVFFKLTKEDFSGFIKLSFEFLKNFQVHFVLYSQENYAFVNILSLTFYTF